MIEQIITYTCAYVLQVSFNVTVTAQKCTDELINGRNLTVNIPGFGQFVVEMTGVCECSCDNNPVGYPAYVSYDNMVMLDGEQ